jgi:hypothetical protein
MDQVFRESLRTASYELLQRAAIFAQARRRYKKLEVKLPGAVDQDVVKERMDVLGEEMNRAWEGFTQTLESLFDEYERSARWNRP